MITLGDFFMKAAVLGYGRVGRGAVLAIRDADDIELVGVYTARPPASVEAPEGVKVYDVCDLLRERQPIDVLILAHGSQSAIRDETPRYARLYSCIDSFDVHAELSAHVRRVHEIGLHSNTLSVVGAGWDPGYLSVVRALALAALPRGTCNTFWGRGVSAGHSEAIRSIMGVRHAIQYTEPKTDALTLAESGVLLSDTARHRRVCYVVAEENDRPRIEREIRTMPHYFLGYDTEVHFIDDETFHREHTGTFHRGHVILKGMTGRYRENRASLDFSLCMDDNGELTGALLVAYARALYRLYREGVRGALSPLEIAPSALLSPAVDAASLW